MDWGETDVGAKQTIRHSSDVNSQVEKRQKKNEKQRWKSKIAKEKINQWIKQ